MPGFADDRWAGLATSMSLSKLSGTDLVHDVRSDKNSAISLAPSRPQLEISKCDSDSNTAHPSVNRWKEPLGTGNDYDMPRILYS